MIHKLQLLVVTTTTIGVWSNLYINYKKYYCEDGSKTDCPCSGKPSV